MNMAEPRSPVRTAFTLAYLAYSYVNYAPSPIVETRNGHLQGFVSKSRDGREYFSFLGIPYAKPPIGYLRFEPPQPLDHRWDEVRQARSAGLECLQFNALTHSSQGSEDCLRLHVYTPRIEVVKNKNPLPVMAFIHGGAFAIGAASNHRAKYLMDEDIVFVAMNFRLGPLGFLNTGDEVVRGNMGLKDQTLALKWVQQNIRNFGGDPNRVTIFGESSGAACVHLHMMSPLSKGLFHGAISQSGSAAAHWSVFKQPRQQSKRFAKKFNCPTENSKAMIKCLKNIDVLVLGETYKEVGAVGLDPIKYYAPTLESVQDENTFLAELPVELIKKGQFNKVPWISGSNSHDGLIVSLGIFNNDTLLKAIRRDFATEAGRMLDISPEKESKTLEKIKEFYIDRKHRWTSEIDKYTNLFSDRFYNNPQHKAAEMQSVHAPVYLYYFALPRDVSFANIIYPVRGKYSPAVEIGYSLASNWVRKKILGMKVPSPGVCHADDLLMFFNVPVVADIKPNSPDYQISKQLVKLWVDFAYQAPLRIQNVLWTPMNSTTKAVKYLKIDRKPSLINAPFQYRLDFWNQFQKIVQNYENEDSQSQINDL